MRSFSVAIVRALANGEMGPLPDQAAMALLAWLHTKEAQADPELLAIAESLVRQAA